ETPKLSIGGGYSYNDRTTREGGQTGRFVQNPFTLKTAFADAIFKYNGFAYQVEYMRRDVDNTFNMVDDQFNNKDGSQPEETHAFKGWGTNQQASYLLTRGYEIATRYTYIKPDNQIRLVEDQIEVMELGLTKYIKAHRLKLQLNVNYPVSNGDFGNNKSSNKWGG